MKKLLIFLTICILCFTSYLIGYNTTTTTTNLELVKIAEGDLIFDWFDTMNDNMDLIDAIFDTVSLIEYGYLDGVTSAIQTQLDAKPDEDTNTTYTGGDFLTLTGTDFDADVKDEDNMASDSATYLCTQQSIKAYADTLHALQYLKTEIDTLGEVETIYSADITDSTELATALTDYYLKTAIDTQGEVETIWGVTLATDTELAALKYTDLEDTPADYTDQAGKYVKVNAGETALEFGTGGGGASQLSDLSDVGVTTPTNKYVLVADGDSWESRAISSDDLSDVASIGMLDEPEEVTGDWLFSSITMYLANDMYPPFIDFARKRDGDPTSNVSSGDGLGRLSFFGYSSSYAKGAEIHAKVDGTPGANDMPGRLEFYTTPDGEWTPVLRMAIDSAGNIKMGDGAWTNYANVDNAGVLTFEGTASINEPLSIMASTTSAELAGVVSDEIGAGKLRFDTSVTAKTTTATLNINEAGTILCSAAGGAYTITLPTASGNTGLTYHFIKTDANYTLITLDGNGDETFNYENSTGAPVATYARLNTYCAEVTIVSDGTNWQVIDEAMGQVPMCRVIQGTDQDDLVSGEATLVALDTEEYDIGSNFTDTAGNYKFTCPVPGKYIIVTRLAFNNTVADKLYVGYIYIGGASKQSVFSQASMIGWSTVNVIYEDTFAATDYIQLYAKSLSGDNTVDLDAADINVRLISKD